MRCWGGTVGWAARPIGPAVARASACGGEHPSPLCRRQIKGRISHIHYNYNDKYNIQSFRVYRYLPSLQSYLPGPGDLRGITLAVVVEEDCAHIVGAGLWAIVSAVLAALEWRPCGLCWWHCRKHPIAQNKVLEAHAHVHEVGDRVGVEQLSLRVSHDSACRKRKKHLEGMYTAVPAAPPTCAT